MYKNKLLLVISFLIALNLSNAQTKRYTEYFLTAGLDFNLNMHNSDFQKLSGIPNCCTSFESTMGLGYTFFVGFDYLLDKNFLSGLKYSAQLSLSDLSANYSQNEFIGNDLLENTYRPITVEHILEANLNYLNIGQAVVVNPLADIPLGVKLGFDVGFPISKTFSQSEKLVEPADVYFTGGKKYRNEYSGDIPLAQSFYFALKAGLNYSVYKADAFEIVPHIEYAYSFSNVTTAQDWSVNVLRVGVAVHYNIPKKDLPKPINPPTIKPEILEIKAEKGDLLVNNFEVSYNNEKLLPNSQINFYNYYVKSVNTNPIPTIFFYKDSESINHIPFKIENDDLSEKLADYLKNNTNAKIEFVSYSTDETEQFQNLRIEQLAKILNINNYKKSYSKISKKQVSKVEMSDEFRKIEVFIDNNKYFVDAEEKLIDAKLIYPQSMEFIPNNKFNFVIDIKNDNDLSEYKVELNSAGKIQNLIDGSNLKRGNNKISKEFAPDLPNIDQFSILYNFSDMENQSKSDKIQIKINKIDTIIETKTNRNIEANGKNISQFIVGYFDFDNDKLSYINTNSIDFIKSEISKGKKIELIAMTDNFGLEEYNIKLAEKRANAVIKLLAIHKEDANLNLKNGGIYDNGNPYFRILNRSVIVRIID